MDVFKNRDKREAVEVCCPTCKRTQIIYLPDEKMPDCPVCRVKMIIKEVLIDGKY